MKVTLWGTRGSIASPGPETARYGGNTSCVEVRGREGSVLVLDAGTGARRLGATLTGARRVDLLLSHLHMDHLQGLGFFAPLYVGGVDVHIWGPPSTTQSLLARLTRYMSPPLFPVRLRDTGCQLTLHEVPCGRFDIGEFVVDAALVCHPGPTVGYRIESRGRVVTYLPDHEPGLGQRGPLLPSGWTSGHELASGADLLLHDAQYTDAEYAARVGWGHSTLSRAMEFAALAGVKKLVPFHHDPSHEDAALDAMFAAVAAPRGAFQVVPAREGETFEVG